MLKKEIWEEKHKESKGRYNSVTQFAKLCMKNFIKKKGKLLELCCGKGADAIYFTKKGLKVSAIDYSQEAINQFNEMQQKNNVFITALAKNILDKLPFEDNTFDYVYSRAGLYYFTDKELKKILSEVNRVLKSEGLLMFQVKSVNDKGYGDGKKVEKDMFEDKNGYVRHYFSKEYSEELLEEFTILLNEERKLNNGSAYLEVVAEKN